MYLFIYLHIYVLSEKSISIDDPTAARVLSLKIEVRNPTI